MPIYPIVSNLDWLSLEFYEAPTEAEALMAAATAWIDGVKSNDPSYEMWIDPKGVTGAYTPNRELKVLSQDGQGQEQTDIVFVIPSYDEDDIQKFLPQG